MMERRSDQVIEKLRRWTHFRVHAETDENGIISMSNDLAVMLEDLCGEAADMIEEFITKGSNEMDDTKTSNMPPLGSGTDHMPPFGSYGDSVTIDELAKRLNEATIPQTPVNTIGTPLNGQNCGMRLPCGICRHTMTMCPLQYSEITWTCQTGTGQTGVTTK